MAAIARHSARAPACSTWNSANRTACWISASPSTSTSARSQNSRRNCSCSAHSPCQPVLVAPASAASTWSCIAGRERVPDQP
ncbi:transposase [Streptomyces roseoverticillatus]|uniref:Transposase n=1 Tax=Streptomyces roseoverticillatus TaxID=66429 RepID=A0ABV3J576_9ACTN